MARPAHFLIGFTSRHFTVPRIPLIPHALRPISSAGWPPGTSHFKTSASQPAFQKKSPIFWEWKPTGLVPYSKISNLPLVGLKNLRSFHRLAKHSIAIRPIQLQSVGEVVELLLTEFRLEEPLFNLLKLKSKECHPFFVDVVRTAVPDRCSYIGVDTSSGVVCAARINSVIKKPPKLIPVQQIADLRQSAKLKYVLQVINQCEAQIFNHIPQNSKVLKFDLVSVAKDYQNKRIATTLITVSMEKAREVDPKTGQPRFTHVVAVATSARAQSLYRDKLGFTSVYELHLKDFIGFDQNRPFVEIQDNPTVQLMVKDLSDHSTPDPMEIQENKANPPLGIELTDSG